MPLHTGRKESSLTPHYHIHTKTIDEYETNKLLITDACLKVESDHSKIFSVMCCY